MTKMFHHLLRFAFAVACIQVSLASGDDWSQFRGPNGASVNKDAKVPSTFGEEKNIAWKIELPGKGASSPIVVGDNVIVTCSSGARQDQLYVCCFSTADGKKRWQRQFDATGSTYCHPLSSNAAPTPVSDGRFIYAFYSSNDLVCLDLDGNLVWFRGLAHDYPKARNDAGMSSSPIVSNGIVVVQIDNQGESFAAGIDSTNGKTVWRKDREREASWSSPLLIPAEGQRRPTVLLQSTSGATTLDLTTGEKVWSAEGKCGTIPSSAFDGKHVFVPLDGTTAYQVDPNGQLKKSWNSPRLRPSTASFVVDKDRIYSLARGGVAACFDKTSGEEVWKMRIMENAAGQYWATPVMAGNFLYFISQDGKSRVIKVGEAGGEVVNKFDFAETVLGSPAVADDAMYVRGDNHLWKIANTN